jgi:hypothetical protein
MMAPLTRRDHRGRDDLNRKEHVAQVGGDALVVELGRHVLPRVAIVSRRVVDQHTGWTEVGGKGVKCPPQGVDVSQVAQFEPHQRSRRGRSDASARPRSPSKSTKPTRELCPAKARTISAPMPDAPPVTNTLVSFRLG